MDNKNFIEDHIKKMYGDDKSDEIFEIILDDTYKFHEIKEHDKIAMEKYKNVNLLSLNFCGIRSLKNLPKLEKLEILELCDNNLNGDELANIPYNNLYKLKLSNNNISKIEQLQPLSKNRGLVVLEMFDCPLTRVENYRDKVFELFPSLTALDGIDKDGNEYLSPDDDEGKKEIYIEDEEDFEDNKSDENYELDDEEDGEEDFDDEEDEEEFEISPKKKKKN